MHGREPEGDPSLDDWFAEPEREARHRRRELDRSPATEDWTDDHAGEREPGYRLPQLTRPEAKIGLAVAALAVVLLIGLAAGGVFSSGGKKAPPPPTTPATQTQQGTTTPSKPTPAFAVPNHQLKPGDKGADVKTLQKALIKLGYLTGTADGAYGPATEAAVKSYQNVTGLTADGILGPKTINALKRSATSSSSASSSTTFDAPTQTLAPGDTGGQVTVLQRELSGLGYAVGTIDGTYGSKTVAAVKAFQQANGLTADGVVGSKTLQVLAAKATSG